MARSGSDKGGRSLFKPAFWMISLCSLMAGAATLGEKFLSDDNPMSALTGMLSPQSAAGSEGADAKGNVVLITPTGTLSDEQRAWLLEQAKKGAPIPLDRQTGQPEAPEAQRDATLEQIEQALKNAGG